MGEPSEEAAEVAAELDAETVPADPDGAWPRVAAEAGGDIVLFLDDGMVLPRQALEAHARWHHAIGDAAVLGVRRAISAEPVERDAVADAVRSHQLDSLLGGESARGDVWVDEALEATDGLTDERLDAFRIGTRGSLSVRAETLAGAGGPRLPPSVDARGVELAYRLFTWGAILVPDEDAAGWQRVAGEASAEDGDGLELERLVPVEGFRRTGSGLVRAVPSIHVSVAIGDQPAAAVAERIGLLLGSGVADASVALELEPGYPEREGLEAAIGDDPRVSLGGGAAPAGCPLTLHLPAAATADSRTLGDVRELMLAESLGALYSTVPGQPPAAATVRAHATRALNRARRVAGHGGGDEEQLIGELFRERWVSGVEIGVRDRDDPAPELADQGPLSNNPELVRERSRTSRERSSAERERAAAERGRRRVEHLQERLEGVRARERSRVKEAKATAERERDRRGDAERKLKALKRSRAHRLARALWRVRRAIAPPKRSR